MGKGEYCRVYWSIIDDPKFDKVYDSDAHLATWLRLLIIADQAYPQPGHLPLQLSRRSLKVLTDVELVDVLPKGRFRIHGLQSERNARASSARNAAALRWHRERAMRPHDAETMLDRDRVTEELNETLKDGRRARALKPVEHVQ